MKEREEREKERYRERNKIEREEWKGKLREGKREMF